MSWNKYKVEKKQRYVSGSGWQDVTPLETRQGEYIATYVDYDDCIGNESEFKLKLFYGEDVYTVPCDSISAVTQEEATPSGYERSAMTKAIIGNCVTQISSNAFKDCINLNSAEISNGVTSIGGCVFYNCSSLTGISIPNSVTSIGRASFYRCTNLEYVNYLPDAITALYDYTFAYCINLTTIRLPRLLQIIDDGCFSWCSGLTSVTIPDYVTSIGEKAFGDCKSLTSITIPNSVTSLGEKAFEFCSGLTRVTIGSGVTSISSRAFEGCSSLTSVTSLATTPPALGSNAFFNTNDCPIYVPASSVNSYKTASGWSDYANRIVSI